MSDIRFNNWKHQSGTGGVSQNSGGNVGIGSTLPSSKLDVGGDIKVTGIVTATSFVGSGANLTGIDATAIQTGTTKIQTSATLISNQVSGSGIATVQAGGLDVTGIVTATGLVVGSAVTSNSQGLDVTGIATISGAVKVGGGVNITAAGSGIFHNPGVSAASGINFHNSDLRFFSSNTERLRITSGGDLNMVNGTVSIKKHAVGIGTTTTAGRNAGVSTAIGEIVYNTTTNRMNIWTINNKWMQLPAFEGIGYYASLTAASADGMSHYWPGNSSTSLISNLSPNTTVGSPAVNQTGSSYDGSNPYFDFYSGNNTPNGYRYTQTTTKWGSGPFTIALWVQPMASTLESETTFVQLGDHAPSATRVMWSFSAGTTRRLKTITIGDDVSENANNELSTNWQHIVGTYSSGVSKYYINGTLTNTYTHGGTLDVGTGNTYIYLGYGLWNGNSTNKASMSHISDVGIWNAKALTASEISNLYDAKRTVSGY